ncbi:hypothetical protein AVEN_140790-1 [Araneus ventricosus]|uniref:CCHC-type domain-containing protein n=1 Tax=Araneus ventricosus TaxID=182803 RepID=A0A4Y2SS60_ARAVE|nr:hypothetical protein AVEN_140790-1 [Araneus ventricosus]
MALAPLNQPTNQPTNQPSHLVGLLKGIKRKGHSLGLALRVITVPGGDPERIGPGWHQGKRRGWKFPEPVAAFPCLAPCGQRKESNVEKYFDHFFIVQRVSENKKTFHSVSPFLVQKAVVSIILGEVASVRKLRSGDLLIEVKSRKQAQQIIKFKALATIPITVSAHTSLNSSKGVVTCGELFNVSVEDISNELKGEGVTHVRRIFIRRDGQLLPTKHLILTFQTLILPDSVKAGYMKLAVRPFIPNPLRCFKCQRFGYSQTNCRGTLTCARCAEKGHMSQQCTEQEKGKTQTPKSGLSYSPGLQKSFCAHCSCTACVQNAAKIHPPEKLSESHTDLANNSAPETCTPRRSDSQSNRSIKLKLSKRGISPQQLTTKLKKSNVKNSVALGLASQGLVHKDLSSIFDGVPKSPDRIALHPSEGEDEEITMSCDVSPTRASVSNTSPQTILS